MLTRRGATQQPPPTVASGPPSPPRLCSGQLESGQLSQVGVPPKPSSKGVVGLDELGHRCVCVCSAHTACAAGAGSASCMTGHVHAVQPPGIVAMQVLARSPRAGAHPCDGPPGVSVWFDVVRPVPCGQQRLRGPGLRPPPGRNGLHQRDRVRAVFAGWGIKLGDGACLGVGAPHPATPVNPPAPRPPVSSFLWSLSLPPPAWGAGIQRHPDLHTPLPGAGTRRQQGLKVCSHQVFINAHTAPRGCHRLSGS